MIRWDQRIQYLPTFSINHELNVGKYASPMDPTGIALIFYCLRHVNFFGFKIGKFMLLHLVWGNKEFSQPSAPGRR